MNTLYAIQNSYQNLFEQLEKAMGEDLAPEQLEQLLAQLEINEAELKEKADAYAAVIRRKEAEAAFLKSEAKRLQELAAREQRQADILFERIADALQSRGLDKLQTDHFRFGFRASESVSVECEPASLPAEYQRTKQVIEADKTELKKALKAGIEIPGVELIENKNLQIK